MDDQSGGYRIQRIPPTEKKNRTHTSTVTVAILEGSSTKQVSYPDEDFRVEWFSGTGAGGQKRNKSQLSCRVIHIPTGLTEARQNKSRNQNFEEAKAALLVTLRNSAESEQHLKKSIDKRDKVGSGMRGDKIITLQFQNDKVTHHSTNKTCRIKDFLGGKMSLIW